MTEIQKTSATFWPVLFIGMAFSLLAAILLVRFGQTPFISPRAPVYAAPKDTAHSLFEMEQAGDATTIRFLLDKVKRDPGDMIAENMLASRMLQRVRETGSADYIQGAFTAARRSLQSVPEIRNIGGLTALTRVEIATHDFTSARTHALQVVDYDPSTMGSYALLFDVLIELGEYAKADAAVQQMRKLGMDTAETEIRFGRLLFLQGDTDGAKRRFVRALAFIKQLAPPPRESLAWCQWQIGEMNFFEGDYQSAEQNYRDALANYPSYVQALASLGRVLAARGQLSGAIDQYEQATRRFPDPTFVAALGDLYSLANRRTEADAQYALVEQIGRLSTLNGARYHRQIAVFEADHNRNAEEAYRNAKREYQDRHDIYGADTLAWTALKAGRLAEAQRAMQTALRLSTRDAKLFYHAGMISKAAGDQAKAQTYLKRALHLSPSFDPLQASLAKQALIN